MLMSTRDSERQLTDAFKYAIRIVDASYLLWRVCLLTPYAFAQQTLRSATRAPLHTNARTLPTVRLEPGRGGVLRDAVLASIDRGTHVREARTVDAMVDAVARRVMPSQAPVLASPTGRGAVHSAGVHP